MIHIRLLYMNQFQFIKYFLNIDVLKLNSVAVRDSKWHKISSINQPLKPGQQFQSYKRKPPMVPLCLFRCHAIARDCFSVKQGRTEWNIWFRCLHWVSHQGSTWSDQSPGPKFSVKMASHQYRKYHCGDKSIGSLSYLLDENSFTVKPKP